MTSLQWTAKSIWHLYNEQLKIYDTFTMNSQKYMTSLQWTAKSIITSLQWTAKNIWHLYNEQLKV